MVEATAVDAVTTVVGVAAAVEVADEAVDVAVKAVSKLPRNLPNTGGQRLLPLASLKP